MRIDVRVHARASRNKLVKNPDGSYAAYLSAPPVKGQANKALLELLSREFDIAKSRVHILKGAAGKNKIVRIGE